MTRQGRQQGRRDYSGLSIAALAFATMTAVAIVAVGCGENIGRSGSRTASNGSVASEQRPAAEPAGTVRTAAVGDTVQAPETEIEKADHTNDAPVTFAEAEAAYNNREYSEAARLFERYVRANEGNSWGFYMLGLSSWKSGDRPAAEDAFRTALELDEGHAKSWVNLARVLIEVERADEALESVDRALMLADGSNEALRTRGNALDELGRTEEAIESYREALVANPEDAWSMNNLGLVYIRDEEFESALPPLARAVELRDDVAVFYNNLGIALERLGYLGQAVEAYSTAVGLDSTYERASGNLARVELLPADTLAPAADMTRLAVTFADEILRWARAGEVDAEGGADMQPDHEADGNVVTGSVGHVEPDSTDVPEAPKRADASKGELDGSTAEIE